MTYDERLASRIAKSLKDESGISEKKMFGGLCFLVHGNMLCGIVGDKLVARVGPDAYEQALAMKHAEPLTFTGRPMKGIVYVGADGTKSKVALRIVGIV